MPLPRPKPKKSRKRKCGSALDGGTATYAALIALAIERSDEQRLLLDEIYQFVGLHRELVPVASHPNWKNSVRHNLSLRGCFIKVPRKSSGGKSLSAFWRLDASCLPRVAKEAVELHRSLAVQSDDLPDPRSLFGPAAAAAAAAAGASPSLASASSRRPARATARASAPAASSAAATAKAAAQPHAAPRRESKPRSKRQRARAAAAAAKRQPMLSEQATLAPYRSMDTVVAPAARHGAHVVLPSVGLSSGWGSTAADLPVDAPPSPFVRVPSSPSAAHLGFEEAARHLLYGLCDLTTKNVGEGLGLGGMMGGGAQPFPANISESSFTSSASTAMTAEASTPERCSDDTQPSLMLGPISKPVVTHQQCLNDLLSL